MTPQAYDGWLKRALAEDAARHDMTSRLVLPQHTRIQAALIAKEPGRLAGVEFAGRIFTLQDNSLSIRAAKRDGDAITSGQPLLMVEGNARSIFAAERTALNLLGHLSGIATLTRAFVDGIRGTPATIFDTRKTLPGLRLLEKYAVRMGGGHNHRLGLHDAVLIKTNHLRALCEAHLVKRTALIEYAVASARRAQPRVFLEVEVTNLRECRAALLEKPDAILLDNWRVADLRNAVQLRETLRASRVTMLEASGGVTLENVRAVANTGVDRISIGRLTHSAPSLDCSLKVL